MQIFKSFSVIFTGTIISRLFIFLFTTLNIRTLSVKEYAIFTLLMSIETWFLVLSHFDLYSAVSKFVSENVAKGHIKEAWDYYYNALYIVTPLSLVCILLAMLFSSSIEVSWWVLLIFFGSLIPVSIMSINSGLIMGYHKYALSSFISICTGFFRFILFFIILQLFAKVGLTESLMSFSFAIAFPFFISYYLANKLKPKQKEWQTQKCQILIIKKLLSYSKWVCLTDILGTGVILFTNLILSFYSYEDVARFGVVILIYSVLQISFGAITYVLIPQISKRAAAGQKIHLLSANTFVLLAILSLGGFAFCFFSTIATDIITFIFKKAFYVDSIQYAALLFLTVPFRIFSMTYKGITQGLGNPRLSFLAALGTIMAYAICLIPLYRIMGLIGVVISLNIVFILEFVFNYFVVKRTLRTRECLT